MELITFCPYCQSRVNYDQHDLFIQCPECFHWAEVQTAQIESQSLQGAKENRQYKLDLRSPDGKQFKRTLNVKESYNLTAGSQISIFERNGRILALNDHSRDLWFPLNQPKRPSKFLNLVSIPLLIIGLSFWIYSFTKHPFEFAIATLIIGLLIFVSSKNMPERSSEDMDNQINTLIDEFAHQDFDN